MLEEGSLLSGSMNRLDKKHSINGQKEVYLVHGLVQIKYMVDL